LLTDKLCWITKRSSDYCRCFALRPRRLVDWLGGGHIALDLKSKGLTTDTIEIDPAVAEASLKYFNFKPTGDFIVGDARYEIQS